MWPIVMFTKCSFFLVCICVRNRRLKSTQSKMNLIWFLEWWWRVTIFFLIDLCFPLLVNLCRRVPLKSTVSLRFNPINHKTRCQQLSVSEKCIILLNENEIDSRNVCVCVSKRRKKPLISISNKWLANPNFYIKNCLCSKSKLTLSIDINCIFSIERRWDVMCCYQINVSDNATTICGQSTKKKNQQCQRASDHWLWLYSVVCGHIVSKSTEK